MKSVFSIIYWNVWLATQDGTKGDSDELLKVLGDIIDEHSPDAFGLNEVLVDAKTGVSPILDHLTNLGYETYFCLFSPHNEQWLIGSAFASKRKPIKIKEHILGNDSLAEQRGYKGYSVRLIEANIILDGTEITVMTNYLMALFPRSWTAHVSHRRSYEKIVNNTKNKYLIIGGDFNEPKYSLPWLRLNHNYKRLTGSFFNPTWRWNGKKERLIRANYDNIVYRKNEDVLLKDFRVLDRKPSDHAPLLAIFAINKQ